MIYRAEAKPRTVPVVLMIQVRCLLCLYLHTLWSHPLSCRAAFMQCSYFLSILELYSTFFLILSVINNGPLQMQII